MEIIMQFTPKKLLFAVLIAGFGLQAGTAHATDRRTPDNTAMTEDTENPRRPLFLPAGPAQINAIFDAAENGLTDHVAMLLDSYNIDINLQDENTDLGTEGYTLLHFAISGRHIALVNMLLKRKANSNIPASDDWTPLHLAASEGNEAIVQLLLDAGADTTLVNDDGHTPSTTAVAYDEEALAIIIDAYAATHPAA